MSFEEHLTEFAGLPVAGFPALTTRQVPSVEPGAAAWRIQVEPTWLGKDFSKDFAERFTAFLESVDVSQVRALVIGQTSSDGMFESGIAVRLLVEHAGRFPDLRAIFFADVIREESDVAYIVHQDLMPILESYPLLEEFHVRGSNYDELNESGDAFRPFKHDALRKLVFESGGLSAEVVRMVGESDIPELEHLEFYFGDPEYGGGAEVERIAWLLSGEKFPKLRHLGLRDAPNADEIAAALAHAPIVARLESLDLSLGALGDEGAAALLAGQPLTHLKSLDLHHHFISSAMTERLTEALPCVELDLTEQNEPDEWDGEFHRYIAVSE